MDNVQEKIRKLTSLIDKEQKINCERESPGMVMYGDTYLSKSKSGSKYTKVDVGRSGKYVVDNQTGIIYGIKAYGVPNLNKYRISLDDIDKYWWGDYDPHMKKTENGELIDGKFVPKPPLKAKSIQFEALFEDIKDTL